MTGAQIFAGDDSARRRLEAALRCGVLLAAFALFAAGIFMHRSVVIDDAFITYRYARNLASGYGLAYNPGGPPVFGFTSPLMVFATTPAFWLGVDPVAFARLLSISATLFALVPLTRVHRRLVSPKAYELGWPLPIVLYLAHGGTSFHAMLGMETALYGAMVATCIWLFFRAQDPPASAGRVAAFFAAGTLAGWTRPEGFAVCLILAAFLLARLRPLRVALPGLALFGALALLQAAWAWSTFGMLAPTAFYLKVSSTPGLLPGADAVLAFVFDHAGWFALAMLTGFATGPGTRPRAPWIPLATLLTFFLLFYMRTLPLMAWEHRFLVPYLALLCWPVAAVLASALAGQWTQPGMNAGRAVGAYAVCGAIIALLLGVHSLRALKPVLLALQGSSAPRVVRYDLAEREIELGRALGALGLGTSLRVAFHDAGAIAYFSDGWFIDTHGLNDPRVVRAASTREAIDYVIEAAPDVVIFPSRDAAGSRAALRERLVRTDGRLGRAVQDFYDAAIAAGYGHAATWRTSYYDLELFVHPQSPHRALLERELRRAAQGT